MSDGVQIKLEGNRDVITALRDLREYLPKTPMRTAVRKAAQDLMGYIALLAPKATGKLVRNIRVRTRYTKSTVRGRVTVNTKGDAKNPDNAFYWRFLEEGFTHWKSGKRIHMPFIVNAFNAMQRRSAQMVIDELEKAIKRAERKAKRGAV